MSVRHKLQLYVAGVEFKVDTYLIISNFHGVFSNKIVVFIYKDIYIETFVDRKRSFFVIQRNNKRTLPQNPNLAWHGLSQTAKSLPVLIRQLLFDLSTNTNDNHYRYHYVPLLVFKIMSVFRAKYYR